MLVCVYVWVGVCRVASLTSGHIVDEKRAMPYENMVRHQLEGKCDLNFYSSLWNKWFCRKKWKQEREGERERTLNIHTHMATANDDDDDDDLWKVANWNSNWTAYRQIIGNKGQLADKQIMAPLLVVWLLANSINYSQHTHTHTLIHCRLDSHLHPIARWPKYVLQTNILQCLTI